MKKRYILLNMYKIHSWYLGYVWNLEIYDNVRRETVKYWSSKTKKETLSELRNHGVTCPHWAYENTI